MEGYIVTALDELSNERKTITVYDAKSVSKAIQLMIENGYEGVVTRTPKSERERLEELIRW